MKNGEVLIKKEDKEQIREHLAAINSVLSKYDGCADRENTMWNVQKYVYLLTACVGYLQVIEEEKKLREAGVLKQDSSFLL